MAFFRLQEGCDLPAHSHENRQTTRVLEGRLLLRIGAETPVEFELGPGDVLQPEANEVHSATALADTRAVDLFIPCRADW